MQDRYTVFIDESGESGIERIRSDSSRGASPYMTLGAALIRNRSRKAVENSLARIRQDFEKPTLHCSHLGHYQIIHFIRKITLQKMRLFGVISRKDTLGLYKDKISSDSDMYYNKCVQYLLERIGWFMESRQIPPENLDIVFERANVDYEKMRNLLYKCQNNPKHETTKKFKFIKVSNICVKKKDEEDLLQIADLVAHALYKCVDKTQRNHGIPEPRYLRELSPYFFGHPETQAVIGAGLYCVHAASSLKLDPDVREIFDSLLANPPS